MASLLGQLTVEEKAELITGKGIWTVHGIERLGIPSLVVTDGPNGARGGGLFATGTETACIPAGSVLGATWDPELVEALGALLGDESKAKGAHVLLAPTINLHRNPLGGRNFECYSEDPLLSGAIAAAFVRGVQARGVATTPKHFAANDSEFERNTIDVIADERTLREVYLRPFEMAVEAGAWGIMSSYNRLNGEFASEHDWLLNQVLRREWGFDGFVVSDWFAARSTADSMNGGMSLEMPGPGRWFGPDRIQQAIDADETSIEVLDALATDMLTALERTGALDGYVGGGEEKTLDRPEDRALNRRAAVSGTVLVSNNGILPLDASTISSIAVIGPNAKTTRIGGGGSAAVKPYHERSPWEAAVDRLGGHATVEHALGANISMQIPPIGAPLLDAPLALQIHQGHGFDGSPDYVGTADKASLTFFGAPAAGIDPRAYSVRLTGSFTPTNNGPHRVALVQAGRTRVLVNDEVVIDATEGDYENGTAFFSMGTVEILGELDLTAGESASLTIEYTNADAVLLCGASVGIESLADVDLLAEAEQLAARCDIALVVVGTNEEWETEGRDREFFALPGDQPELIKRVAAANPRTIVAVNAGGPQAMDWLDAPGATLITGFGGQELGDALLDVILGEADPGGRMPTTIPARYEHSPAYLNYPGENSTVRYGEGLHIGHRFFDARHIDPAVAFGHGLSYATFEWSEPTADAVLDIAAEMETSVSVEITNTSTRRGVEVVQLYVAPPPSVVHRPPKELKGFAKVELGPGETTTVSIPLDFRSFCYFDPGDRAFDSFAGNGPVPAVGARRHLDAGWWVEPGTYQLVVSRSALDAVATVPIELTGEELRLDP